MKRLAGKVAFITGAGSGIGRALYLASDESRIVIGQILPVDSGVSIS